MAMDILKIADATNQNRYYNSVKEAYIREKDIRPMFKYMKTTSTKNATYAIYYSSGILTSTFYTNQWDVSPAVGLNPSTPTPGNALLPATLGIDPVNQVEDLWTSHRMPFKKAIVPYWLKEEDLENTQVDLSNTVVKEQARGLVAIEEKEMLDGLSRLVAGTFQVDRANNQEDFVNSTIGIPTANVVGNAGQVLDTTSNWGFFREITVKARSLTGGRFCIVTGHIGQARILNSTKTESRDFVPNANSVVTGKLNDFLFGGELFVFPQFDEIFDVVTTGIVPFFIICNEALAYDRPTSSMRTVAKRVEEKMAYFFNAVLRFNMTVIDETGIFLLNTLY